jgi:TolA-binding protein
MQSANGLMVNGESYAQSALRSGDVLELGHVKLKFVGAGERVENSDLDSTANVAATGGGSKAPMYVAVATVVIAVLAGGAWMIAHKKPPRPVVIENTPDNPTRVSPRPAPQVQEELTPEQQREGVEIKLKEARNKIDQLDWDEARKILKGCFIGESMHPEATKLLTELKDEEPLRAAIDKADQLIDSDNLVAAKEQLDSAEHTRFLGKRWTEVREKLNRATQKKIQESANAKKNPPAANPNPPDVAQAPGQPTVPKAVPVSPQAEAQKLYEDAHATFKGGDYPKAKALLQKCLIKDRTYADCHKLLGATLGQMGDGAGGAKEYELFIKFAPPDHPQIPKVKALLEQYRAGGGK